MRSDCNLLPTFLLILVITGQLFWILYRLLKSWKANDLSPLNHKPELADFHDEPYYKWVHDCEMPAIDQPELPELPHGDLAEEEPVKSDFPWTKVLFTVILLLLAVIWSLIELIKVLYVKIGYA